MTVVSNRKPFFPVIDLFAGPGGLGEGFSSFNHPGKRNPFRICLSIEKDQTAAETLRLRSFFRQFPAGEEPADYYSYAKRDISWEILRKRFKAEVQNAENEALCAELGKTPEDQIHKKIDSALSCGDARKWVLIGGPPCQAYSVAGRSRMSKQERSSFESDTRHYLYREYLRIIHRFKPPVFVFENVRGILSSKIGGENIFGKILSDLRNPLEATGVSNWGEVHYEVFSLVNKDSAPENLTPADFLVESEKYGIPQARHRVILFGVRTDIPEKPGVLKKADPDIGISVSSVLSGLQPLRSRLSGKLDSIENWYVLLKKTIHMPWYRELKDTDVKRRIRRALKEMQSAHLVPGDRFILSGSRPEYSGAWYRPGRQLVGTFNHETRSHMESDLQRYLFVSCFGLVHGYSPKLRDFPPELYPDHTNVSDSLTYGNFNDRFRVQIRNKPATTITSHISKDGHYFIHPDPVQCRSLTVREAARIQTFPDNYIFEGSRTSQYRQVGNAVPPLLARQIAEIAFSILEAM